ncbi:MAG TPA: MFS transporter, partial [Reyranella sp.]|nr:MFS transporter [Reyranella sp.]
SGFLALACLAALGLVPVLMALPRRIKRPDGPSHPLDEFREVRRSRLYKVQISSFAAMALAFAGMLAHFVPLLRDAGLSIERAGALAGLIGLSVIVTRVIVGWLADRFEPAWLGAASCAVCAVGCLLLGLGGPALAPVAAIALGAAMGAEADLVGILTARNFPLGSFSNAYSRQYAAFMVAAGISPLWIGYLADQTGGYDLPLYVCTAGLMVPIALFTSLAFSRRQ